MSDRLCHLTPEAKAHELRVWDEKKAGERGTGGFGYPDDAIIPLCDEINALPPHVCTLQSCSGHKPGQAQGEFPGSLWLWFDQAAFRLFVKGASETALAPGIEQIAILSGRYNDCRAVVEIIFDGLNKNPDVFARSTETILKLVKEVMPDASGDDTKSTERNSDVAPAPTAPGGGKLRPGEYWCDMCETPHDKSFPCPGDVAPEGAAHPNDDDWEPSESFTGIAVKFPEHPWEVTDDYGNEYRIRRVAPTVENTLIIWIERAYPEVEGAAHPERCQASTPFCRCQLPKNHELHSWQNDAGTGGGFWSDAHPVVDAPGGPWKLETGSQPVVRHATNRRYFRLATVAEAIAVRDALNREAGKETPEGGMPRTVGFPDAVWEIAPKPEGKND